MRRQFKNLLVQYKGGGYDGCFWEWNFFYFDSKGKFHNLTSTGRMGIKTRYQAIDIINQKPDRFGFKSPDFYYYKTNRKKSVEEFQNEVNERLVAECVDRINRIENKNIMYWECDSCARKCHNSDAFHTGYKGDGGIGVIMLGKLCPDCYITGVCDHCHEYDDGEKIFVKTEHSEDYCCKWCAESISEAAIKSNGAA